MTWTTVALIACVALMAWLTAGAIAVRSASRIWLRHWAERQLTGSETVLMYLERPQRLLTAANATVALIVSLAGAVIGWRGAGGAEELTVLALSGYAALVLLAGQLVPRAIARRWPAIVIPVTMPALRVAARISGPLLFVGRVVARVSRETLRPKDPRAAMATLLREGELEGIGNRDEIAIINGVMQFGERTLRDVMTPRAHVFAVSEDTDGDRLAARIAESGFSRIPVYRGSMDTIVGMYHAFDLLNEGAHARPRLRPIELAPADSKCSEMLFRMLRQRHHVAIVQEAAGATLGLATLEDLLEELVGDIRDEHDEPAARAPRAGA